MSAPVDGLSVVGSIVVNPAALGAAPAQQYVIPAMPGTQKYETSAVRAVAMAAGVADYYAWSQGLSMSYIDVVTLCPPVTVHNWFTAAILNGAFRADATSGIMGVYATDGTTGMGPIQFTVAQLARTDDGESQTFAGCRFDNLRLSWTAGRAIQARFRIWLFGAPTIATGTAPANGAQNVGGLLMGQNVTSSGFTRLYGGEIRINGNMAPDLSSYTASDANGKSYITNFFNQVPPKMTLDLTQAVGATAIKPATDDVVSDQSIVFNKSTGAAVTLAIAALAPDLTKPMDLTLPLFTRSYETAGDAASDPSFLFS